MVNHALICDLSSACSVGWFVSLLVREEVLLAGLYKRKIIFWLEIYDRLRQATAKRTANLSITASKIFGFHRNERQRTHRLVSKNRPNLAMMPALSTYAILD